MRFRAVERLLLVLVALATLVLGVYAGGCAGDEPTEEDTSARDASPLDAARPDVAPVDAAPKDAAPSDAAPKDGGADAAPTPFRIATVASTGNKAIEVTFDAPPNPSEAVVLANYAVPGLTLIGTPTLAGSAVTLVTSAQLAQSYMLTVSGVTRASDHAPLAAASKAFAGRTSFNVESAAATSTNRVTVTFDAPPDPTQAATAGNYAVPGLTVSAAALSGKVATLTTTVQTAKSFAVTVSGVARASDGEQLAMAAASFTGRDPFGVASAQSTDAVTMTITFDAAPSAAQAATLANYTVPGLVLSGTPALVGNTVTLKTSGQLAQAYTATVANVTRAADGERLLVDSANFNGTAVLAPTVTNVVVTATAPDNGATAYNTGATTVTITGTDLGSVACPDGVALDDLDGIDGAVKTKATSCTVDSDTQITATYPRGIRTNGATGWNVVLTNAVGSNATSAVRFVPVAGLLISEVYTGTSGVAGSADHEYLEIYNPTATAIDTSSATGIGLKLHIRTSGGSDSGKTLTAVTAGVISSHGFLLIVSAVSDATDAWYASRDHTYSTSGNSLVGNGGAYISLSASANAKVLDKVGWGTQPAFGFEGTALANIAADVSAERKPAGGAGHATDSDANLTDFNAPSTVLTPRGTADAAQP